MSDREKKLAMMVGFCVVAIGLMATYHQLVIAPAEQLDRRIVSAQNAYEQEIEIRDQGMAAQDTLARLAARSFGGDANEAAASASAMLTRTIEEVGLADERFARRPIAGSPIRGGAEIGFRVQGAGPLDKIIDLLYLLENGPHLQRLENIVISPDSRNEDEVSVSFRFLTLVLNELPAENVEPLDEVQLADETRQIYDPILARNVLRPYVPKPPEPEPEPEVATPEPEPEPEPAGPGPETFRVVSLSEWRGESEIIVYDTTNDRTIKYAPGDKLADGTVIMVDYRPLPMPDNPGIRSQSRVIVDVGSEYWAIERGMTLADKRRLSEDELPPDLVEQAAELSHQAE